MAVPFLSDTFFEEGGALVNADPAVLKAIEGRSLRLAVDIVDGPAADFTYHIVISSGQVQMGRGDIDDPDARVRNSYDVAARLARGELANQMALLTGKVKISSGMGTLVKNQGPLDLIQGVLSTVEATY